MADAVFALLKIVKLQFHPVWGKLPGQVDDLFRNLIELLAAIPSVVYGLWGLFVVIPLVRPACNWLHAELGWIPLFGTDLSGPGMLPAVIVLSIMILPTITAIGRGALVAVPSKLRMAAYGLGATRWETILAVTAPSASRGIFGGVVLAFGRALGETMALAMLLGNAECDQHLVVLPGQHAGRLAGERVPGGRPQGRRGTDVCRDGAACHHPGGECGGGLHHAEHFVGSGRGEIMTASGHQVECRNPAPS